MRILDQSGAFADLPYELSEISVSDGAIFARFQGNSYVMASYSSAEIALRALKKLRIAYQQHENNPEVGFGKFTEYFQFPPEGDL